jgi:hypothetical protein
VAEAAILLLLAKSLIWWVPMGLWRRTLGAVGGLPTHATRRVEAMPLVAAVERAGQRLPGEYVCLPRAMAVQWMLRRRGIGSALVFGIARDMKVGQLHDLHAWVEVGDSIVIGAMPERSYARGLALVQPAGSMIDKLSANVQR